MTALLAAFLFFVQGVPAAAVAQTGIVTGVLKDAEGRLISGARLAAIPAGGSADDLASAAMASIGVTDEQGRFVLAGIPPGRYYIAAGRVDAPTYYPGTEDIRAATVVSVAAAASISGIDFAMGTGSLRPAGTPDFVSTMVFAIPIPLEVRVEGDGKIPISSGGNPTLLRLLSSDQGPARATPLNRTTVDVPTGREIGFTVDGLPAGYAVRSITYGSTDLSRERLLLPPAYHAIVGGGLVSLVESTPQRRSTEVVQTLPYPPTQTITLVLTTTPQPDPRSGVRVAGQAYGKVNSIYLSGLPGTYYADSSFEFRGIPPGRHILAGLGAEALGAIVVVGERNITGVELRDVAIPLPADLTRPQEPDVTGTAVAGSVLQLASVSGILREESSRNPVNTGVVKIKGYARTESFTIGADGRFSIPRLFPGTYSMEIDTFGLERVLHELTVGAENITLDLMARRL